MVRLLSALEKCACRHWYYHAANRGATNSGVPIISVDRCLLCMQANIHKVMMKIINTHRMTAKNQYDDVYRSLVQIITGGVSLAFSKDQLPPRYPAARLGGHVAEALQGYVAMAEQQQRPADRPSQPPPLPQARWIRNAGYRAPTTCTKGSFSDGVLSLHFPLSAESFSAMQISNVLLRPCYTLYISDPALSGSLMLRLGVPEAALR